MTEYEVIVCVRVTRLLFPSVSSEQRLCSSCHSLVWITMTSLKLQEKLNLKIICQECAEKEIWWALDCNEEEDMEDIEPGISEDDLEELTEH